MNVETAVIKRMLIGGKEELSKFESYELSPSMFHSFPKEASWLFSFYEKHTKLPSLKLFKNKFPHFSLPKTKDSLGAYVDLLRDKEMKTLLSKVVKRCEPLIETNTAEGISRLQQELEAITKTVSSSSAIDLSKLNVKSRMKVFNKRRELLESGSAVLSPWKTLNKFLNAGFRPENLVTIASRWNVGKTFILCVLALYYAKLGYRILFVSKEMSGDEIQERLEAILSEVSWPLYLKGKLGPKGRKRLRRGLKRLKKLPIIISGEASLEATGLQTLVADIDRHRPEIVFVDGIYQYEVNGVRDEVQKMLNISRKVKRIMKSRKVIGFQTVQLNRQAEGKNKTGASTLSWSDAFGQDADVLLELDAPDGKRDLPYRLISVLKGRNMGFGEFFLNFDMKKCDFSEMKNQPVPQKDGKKAEAMSLKPDAKRGFVQE